MSEAPTESLPRERTPASHDAETLMPGATPGGGSSHRNLERGAALGRYVLLGQLGRGGMGVVYAAYDPELDRKIAIKLVLDDRGGVEGRLRLQREAQALAKVTHPNIAAVFDVGSHGDAVFVAMEFIDGDTLAAWERKRGVPVPWRDAVDVYLQAGRGLAAAHNAGIVHRDFKPHNVMIDRAGRVVVLDFGLARPSGETSAEMKASGSSWSGLVSDELTAAGSLIGTPAYMSPEQLAGESTDAASDQFSFCVSLWHAVFGEAPFAGSSVAELAASVLHHELRAPPRGANVPTALRIALERGLSRDPDARHPSMNALLDALQLDTGRTRRRVGVALIVAAALGGALWAGQRAADDDPCAAPSARLAAAWGDERRADVSTAFRADKKAHNEPALTKVSDAIDEVTAQWWVAREAVCSSNASTATQLARARCLDDQIVRIDAITRVLAGADQRMLGRAPAVLHLLPDPVVCEDDDAAHDTAPLPDDVAMQERVEALRARSYDAKAMADLGDFEAAAAIASSVYDESVALGYAPLAAEAALNLGDMHLIMQRYDEALVRLEEASLGARAIGHEEVVLGSGLQLTFLHTQRTGRLDLAEWMLRDTEALAQRFRGRPRVLVEIGTARARIALARGDLDDGVHAIEAALTLLDALPQEGLEAALALQLLAQLHLERKDLTAADAALARGAAVATELLGPPHPLHADFLLGRARLAASQGRNADAIPLIERTIEVYEAAHVPASLSLSAALNGLGLVLEADGQPERAATVFARAIALHRDGDSADHPQMAIIASNAGNLLRRLGRASESLPLHREALAIDQARGLASGHALSARENVADDLRVLGRCSEAEFEYREVMATRDQLPDQDTGANAYAWVGLGLCRMTAGALDEAIVMLQRAVELHRVDDRVHAEAGIASFALAIALRRDGRDAREVDTSVATAREHFSGPPKDAALLAELDRFVAGDAIAMPTY